MFHPPIYLAGLTSGITDVRVAHPKCGEINFVITFLGEPELKRFLEGCKDCPAPGTTIFSSLASCVEGGGW
jgi:hypothetical protein